MRKLYIFLNNKLIACDTIVPLIKEVCDTQPDLVAEFVTFDRRTWQAVVDNVVLADAIKTVGRLRMLGRQRKAFVYGLVARLRLLPWLLKLVVEAARGKAQFLHFKELNSWPFKLLAILFPGRTIFSQSTAIGYHPLEKKVSEIILTRRYSTAAPAGQHILAFDPHWDVLEDERVKTRSIHWVSPPFTRRHWQDYLRSRGQDYFVEAFRAAGLEASETIIAYMLCWMGPNNQTREPDQYPKLFDETLGILAEVCPGIPVFVKPHPADAGNVAAFAQLQAIAQRHPTLKLVFTHLHPAVLSIRAKFFIANTYSSTFAIPRHFGLPTIEYTDYAEAVLKETGGGSARPDMVTHFINHDAVRLRGVMTALLAAPAEAKGAENHEVLPESVRLLFSR